MPAASPTMAEGLKKLLGDIGMLLASPDADQQFLSKLQEAIWTRLKQPSPMGQQPQGPQQMGQPQLPQHMPGGGVGGSGGFGGAGMGATMPNPDELRRVLAGVPGQ